MRSEDRQTDADPSAEAVAALLKELLGVAALDLPTFERALGGRGRLASANPHWQFYDIDVEDGPFVKADLRLARAERRALLSLTPRGELGESDVASGEWGELRGLSPNPSIPPEGADTFTYEVRGVALSFQLTHTSRRVRTVTLEWGAEDRR